MPYQGAVDGNTVEMDTERAKFAENTLRFQFARDRVSESYKDMQQLLNSIKN